METALIYTSLLLSLISVAVVAGYLAYALQAGKGVSRATVEEITHSRYADVQRELVDLHGEVTKVGTLHKARVTAVDAHIKRIDGRIGNLGKKTKKVTKAEREAEIAAYLAANAKAFAPVPEDEWPGDESGPRVPPGTLQ